MGHPLRLPAPTLGQGICGAKMQPIRLDCCFGCCYARNDPTISHPSSCDPFGNFTSFPFNRKHHNGIKSACMSVCLSCNLLQMCTLGANQPLPSQHQFIVLLCSSGRSFKFHRAVTHRILNNGSTLQQPRQIINS